MSRGPCLGLAASGHYCGRPRADRAAARWARRHLIPCVPHVRIPGAGVVFSRQDLDAHLAKFIVEPVDPTPPRKSSLDEILGPRRARGAS